MTISEVCRRCGRKIIIVEGQAPECDDCVSHIIGQNLTDLVNTMGPPPEARAGEDWVPMPTEEVMKWIAL